MARDVPPGPDGDAASPTPDRAESAGTSAGPPPAPAASAPPAQRLPVNTLLTLARKATGLHVRSSDVTVSLVRQAAAEGKAAEPDPVSAQVEALRQDSAQILQAAIDALSQTIEQQSAQQRDRELLQERERQLEAARRAAEDAERQRARREADDDPPPPRARVSEAPRAAGSSPEGADAAAVDDGKDPGGPGPVVTPAASPRPALGYDRPTPLATRLDGGASTEFDADELDVLAPELGLPVPAERLRLQPPSPPPPPGDRPTNGLVQQAHTGPAVVAVDTPAPYTGRPGEARQSSAAPPHPGGSDRAGPASESRPSSPPDDPPEVAVQAPEAARAPQAPQSLAARREALRAQLAELERRRQALLARRSEAHDRAGAAALVSDDALMSETQLLEPDALPTDVPLPDAPFQDAPLPEVTEPFASEASPSESHVAESDLTAAVPSMRVAPDEIETDTPISPDVASDAPEAWDEFHPARNGSAASGAMPRPGRWLGPSWRNGELKDSHNGTPSGVAAPTRFTRMRVEGRNGRPRGGSALWHALTSRWTVTPIMAVALLFLAALVTPLPGYFGWQVLPVLSGSMEPSIPVGSVVVETGIPGSSVRVGDVITYADRGQPDVLVTHRVESIETRDGQTVAVTKGDANNAPDVGQLPLDQQIGRVAFAVPYLGYLSVWLGSGGVKLVALLLVVLLMVGPPAWRAVRGGRTTQEPPSQLDAEPSLDELAREIDALLGTHSAATGSAGSEKHEQAPAGAPRADQATSASRH